MKNCFFLVLMTMFCTNITAQRYCDLEVYGGVSGTTINIDPGGTTPTYIDLYFRNNGADTLKETDTVYFFSDFLTGGSHVFISPVLLIPGGEINIKDTFYFKSGPPDSSIFNLCDSVWFTSLASDPGVDTVIANNRNCKTLQVIYNKTSAISEQFLSDKTKTLLIRPNPASALIELDFTARNNEMLQVEVYDISGRIVLTHSYGRSFQTQSGYMLDVSTLQSGAYFISVQQDGLQLIGKLLKQ